MRSCISNSVNFTRTLRMPTSARDLRPGLDCFTMRTAIFAVFCCQTTATGMFTTVHVLIVPREALTRLIGIGLTVEPRFDLVLAVRWEFRQQVFQPAAVHWYC